MRGGIVLDPVLSCEMINPAIKKLDDLFENGFNVIYIYGPTGTGKSLAVELLIDEYDYAVYTFDDDIKDIKQVIALSRFKSLLDPRKTVVLVDGIDQYSKDNLELLAKGDWNFNKLILIGENYPKKANPLAPFSKSKKYSFKKIKFSKIDEREMRLIVSTLAGKYKKPMLKETVDKIVKASDGDVRKLLNITKNYFLAGGDVETFLPQCEETEFNRVRRIFSGNFEDALEEIENFGWYYSIMIIQSNLEGKKDSERLMEVLMTLSQNKSQDRERLLAVLACKIHEKYTKGKYTKWIFPKKAAKSEKSNIDALCSDMKKEMYFV